MINKIYLVVHPAYEQTREYDVLGNKRQSPTKATRALTRNEYAQYGQIVQIASREKNSILIIIEPELEQLNFASKEYERFKAYSQKKLGTRMLTINTSFGYQHTGKNRKIALWPSWLQLKTKLFFVKLAKRVQIESTGQYKDGCVNRSTLRIAALLRKRGIHVTAKTTTSSKEKKTVQDQVLATQSNDWRPFTQWRRQTFGNKTNMPKGRKK
jgi:hypothetical protein